jgi:hypothetical protein
VVWIVPLSLGDAHRGFRVLGTTTDYFEHYMYRRDRGLEFAAGARFSDLFDAVLGADVARDLGYRLGDEIVISHGIGRVSFQHHEDKPFRVAGILHKTGTPVFLVTMAVPVRLTPGAFVALSVSFAKTMFDRGTGEDAAGFTGKRKERERVRKRLLRFADRRLVLLGSGRELKANDVHSRRIELHRDRGALDGDVQNTLAVQVCAELSALRRLCGNCHRHQDNESSGPPHSCLLLPPSDGSSGTAITTRG